MPCTVVVAIVAATVQEWKVDRCHECNAGSIASGARLPGGIGSGLEIQHLHPNERPTDGGVIAVGNSGRCGARELTQQFGGDGQQQVAIAAGAGSWGQVAGVRSCN